MKVENGTLCFSSGKTSGYLGGVLGLGLDDDTLYYGYDGTLGEALGEGEELADVIELADYMIARWLHIRGAAMAKSEQAAIGSAEAFGQGSVNVQCPACEKETGMT